jgi:hypothetical protein
VLIPTKYSPVSMVLVRRLLSKSVAVVCFMVSVVLCTVTAGPSFSCLDEYWGCGCACTCTCGAATTGSDTFMLHVSICVHDRLEDDNDDGMSGMTLK